MMFAAIGSVTVMAIVAFAIGFVCGKDAGVHRGRELAHDACLEWARLVLHGHQRWRGISPAGALRRAAAMLIEGRL